MLVWEINPTEQKEASEPYFLTNCLYISITLFHFPDWFMKRLGAQKVINTVLFLYSLRLLSLAAASHMGTLWVTAVVEVINGPCFGLGYTAIIVHASTLTPRGFSTTVQSIVGVCYGTLGMHDWSSNSIGC